VSQTTRPTDLGNSVRCIRNISDAVFRLLEKHLNARIPAMRPSFLSFALCFFVLDLMGAGLVPAPQAFRQEIATFFDPPASATNGKLQLLDFTPDGSPMMFAGGDWFRFGDGQWRTEPDLRSTGDGRFKFRGPKDNAVEAAIPWKSVRQVLRAPGLGLIATSREVRLFRDTGEEAVRIPEGIAVNQAALSPEGELVLATTGGLFRRAKTALEPVLALDPGGRVWGGENVGGVTFDPAGRLWVGTKAGVACRSGGRWTFYEGKDGVPWSDFTGIASGRDGVIRFGTHLGLVAFDGTNWSYRQGKRWLRDDDVQQVAVSGSGETWIVSTSGLTRIDHKPMTLAAKAELYETEIEKYIKRTPLGYVAEGPLRKAGDRATSQPQDSDNDGLWTAMYGAGECFAYAATKDPKALQRARQAFEALRFLQKVTQGCEHAPPKGYVARTIRPIDWPDPNAGRLQGDIEAKKQDRLWKVYEPRWPKSADGKWFWKSDTSSDELDGHFFFYPLYYDFCADTESERNRVREVVGDLAGHLLAHDFTLVDHDGKPTRWGVFGPQVLNRDPDWWQERGLNSLSILAYLAVASHITGDPKFSAASKDLIANHGYAQNLMFPKNQRGAGSGNQSDDEMAFMCFYTLLRCSTDEALKARVRHSFYNYWINEANELNPFFNFAYSAHNLTAVGSNPWGPIPLAPSEGWQTDAMATLYGFPLDRLNWAHQNSHRLDLVFLPVTTSIDPDTPDQPRRRGYRVNGKVLPVENRFFNHWNTDPWHLDYGGSGNELGAGTVFLLPYYMGLYHGFVAHPTG
jgi:hypothetical protein